MSRNVIIGSLVRSAKRNFYLASALLGISIISGYYFAPKSKCLLVKTPLTWHNIFLNNVAPCIQLISGIISLAIFTISSLIINGLVIGESVRAGIHCHGITALFGKVLIHGVFEIPALLIAAAIGLEGVTLFWDISRITEKQYKRFISFKMLFWIVEIIICLILLVVAAIIEALI